MNRATPSDTETNSESPSTLRSLPQFLDEGHHCPSGKILNRLKTLMSTFRCGGDQHKMTSWLHGRVIQTCKSIKDASRFEDFMKGAIQSIQNNISLSEFAELFVDTGFADATSAAWRTLKDTDDVFITYSDTSGSEDRSRGGV